MRPWFGYLGWFCTSRRENETLVRVSRMVEILSAVCLNNTNSQINSNREKPKKRLFERKTYIHKLRCFKKLTKTKKKDKN